MTDILKNFLKWAWDLITGIQPAVEWLFNKNETISYAINVILNTLLNPDTPYDLSIAPIYRIGGGVFVVVLIGGILRAIL